MDYSTLIAQFGYLAVLIGTIIEGEAVLLLAGFLAHKGYLDLVPVITLGFLGTYCSEAFIYHLGRRHGRAFMGRRSDAWQSRHARFSARLHRHRYLLIIFYRFFYGMRSVAPFAIGTSGVRPLTFHSLNLIGTLMWTSIMATLGFFFGSTLEKVLSEIEPVHLWVVAGGVLALFLCLFYYRLQKWG